jgi:hypothetical protein
MGFALFVWDRLADDNHSILVILLVAFLFLSAPVGVFVVRHRIDKKLADFWARRVPNAVHYGILYFYAITFVMIVSFIFSFPAHARTKGRQ